MKETSKGEGLVYVTSIAVHGRERRRDDARVLTVTVEECRVNFSVPLYVVRRRKMSCRRGDEDDQNHHHNLACCLLASCLLVPLAALFSQLLYCTQQYIL